MGDTLLVRLQANRAAVLACASSQADYSRVDERIQAARLVTVTPRQALWHVLAALVCGFEWGVYSLVSLFLWPFALPCILLGWLIHRCECYDSCLAASSGMQ